MFCMYVCLCNTHVPGALRGQETALDSQVLKLNSCEPHMGLDVETWSSGENSRHSQPQNHLSLQHQQFYFIYKTKNILL